MKRAAPLKALLTAAVLLAIGMPPGVQAKEASSKRDTPRVASQTVMVPMRDGTRLATEIYLPTGEGPWPTILVMTPYGRKGVETIAGQAGKREYALVSQDFRGRFDSEGDDHPVFLSCGWREQQDGYDTVEWIARQKWSNGKVGGWGLSAPGIALNMTAPSRAPHLTCCYVGVAFSNMYTQSAYQGGAFRKALLENWLAQCKFSPKNLELIRAHPDYDDFWKRMAPETVAARVNVPTMFLGGWYDIFTAGSLASFTTINKQGDVGARGRCRLVMEPYGHGRSEDLVFPDAGLPQAADMWNWFDVWLKNDGKGIDEIPAVQYYVMGDPADPNTPGNRWRTAEDWPVPATMVNVYFHTDKKLRLSAPQELFGSLAYRYDPKDPVPTLGGANLMISKGPKDQRPVEDRRDVLVFTSPTLDRYVEITGPVTVRLWASSTAPDTDFTAKLCDVYPDGRSMIVLDGILRAGHRNSLEKTEPLEAGKIYEVEIDLWATSLVISPGHRVSVAISSSNAPRFEPNPNTGTPSGTDDRTEVATNTIYMNASHPSHIMLPVVPR
jgi:predicted acyl esterase